VPRINDEIHTSIGGHDDGGDTWGGSGMQYNTLMVVVGMEGVTAINLSQLPYIWATFRPNGSVKIQILVMVEQGNDVSPILQIGPSTFFLI
jgi:hypothetical protein